MQHAQDIPVPAANEARQAVAFLTLHLGRALRIYWRQASTREKRSQEVTYSLDDQAARQMSKNVIIVRCAYRGDAFPVRADLISEIHCGGEHWYGIDPYADPKPAARPKPAPKPVEEPMYLWRAEFYLPDVDEMGENEFIGSLTIKARRGESAETSEMLQKARRIADLAGVGVCEIRTTYKGRFGSASLQPRNVHASAQVISYEHDGTFEGFGQIYKAYFENLEFCGSLAIAADDYHHARERARLIAREAGLGAASGASYDHQRNGEEGAAKWRRVVEARNAARAAMDQAA